MGDGRAVLRRMLFATHEAVVQADTSSVEAAFTIESKADVLTPGCFPDTI